MNAGPVDLFVDTEKLNDLGRELHLLVDLLRAMNEPVWADAVSMGDEGVADTIHRFANRWEASRHDLVAAFAQCLDHVQSAIDNYTATERSIAAAAAEHHR